MRYQVIAFPLGILMGVFMFINFTLWYQVSVYEFEQRQMDLQVNYAVDAAVQEMLANGTHLGTDYADWGSMTIEPEVALDTYLAVLIRNLGWADSEENREDLIESSMPFFCVATYDGYYMYMRQQEKVNGVTTYPHVWTPKLPYSDLVADPSHPGMYTYYFYNVGETSYGTYTEYNNKVKYDNVLNATASGPGSLERAQEVVSDTLTDACNSALYIGLMGEVDNELYIPASFSQWSNSNPVKSPSVLTYMSRSDETTKYDKVTFGIGGAKIDDAQFCICYQYNGVPCYTWADNRAEVESRGSVVERVTTTPEDAAKAGYYFDFTLRR